MRYKRCPSCQKRRPATSFHGRTHRSCYCRVCMKLRRNPPPAVAQIIRDFGDLDTRLHPALGPQWPYTLQKAREGFYARA